MSDSLSSELEASNIPDAPHSADRPEAGVQKEDRFPRGSKRDYRALGNPDLCALNVKHWSETAQAAGDLHAARKLNWCRWTVS